MRGRLEGKIAVVTGSTSGIGAAIARAMAAQGARVVVSGRRVAEGQSVVDTITSAGGQAVFQQADVCVPEDCARVCARAQEEFGGLDVLVNNAGIFPRKPLAETTPEFWDNVFATNVRAAFLCSQAAIPLMRARGGGSIINIGSCHAFRSRPELFAYACSKGALYAMTSHLARQLAPDLIRVNWITVGWVLTEKELETQAAEGRDAAALRERQATLPMGQFNTEEDTANGCIFLASDDAARVTGATLDISAGLSIRF